MQKYILHSEEEYVSDNWLKIYFFIKIIVTDYSYDNKLLISVRANYFFSL